MSRDKQKEQGKGSDSIEFLFLIPGSLKLHILLSFPLVMLGIAISSPKAQPSTHMLLKVIRVVIYFLALINTLNKQSHDRQDREVGSEKKVEGIQACTYEHR